MNIRQTKTQLVLGEETYTREERDGVWHAVDDAGEAHVEADLVAAYVEANTPPAEEE